MTPILTFKVTYVNNGCKMQCFINTDLDLDMFDFEEMTSFLKQSNMFEFDTVLTWHYVDIVAEFPASIEEDSPKRTPTLKYGRKKTDKTVKPQVSK